MSVCFRLHLCWILDPLNLSDLSDICLLIQTGDIIMQMKNMSDSATGLDGVQRLELRNISVSEMAAHCNLWLLRGCPPTHFTVGYTSLVAKHNNSDIPGEYRPITISSIIDRLYHKSTGRQTEHHANFIMSDGFPKRRRVVRKHCAAPLADWRQVVEV